MESLLTFLEGYSFSILALLLVGVIVLKWSVIFPKNLPPGPYNLPVLGCLPLIGSHPHISLHKLFKNYGDIMYLKLGTVPFVIASSARAAEEFLKSPQAPSRLPTVATTYLGSNFNGVGFGDYTPEIKLRRRIINGHLLSAPRLKAYDTNRNREHAVLAQYILSQQGKPFKLIDSLSHVNANIISCMLFGKPLYGPPNGKLDGFLEILMESMQLAGVFNISDFIPAIRWLDVQRLERRYKQLMARVNKKLSSILQERKANSRETSNDEPMPFIDVLISLDSTKERVSDATKQALLFEMLLGGSGTSAFSVEWAMTELIVHHPDKLKKAQKELDNIVVTNRLVETSDLPKLEYTEAIAKEILRLHTLAPLTLPKACPPRFGGYTIPEGTRLLINFYSISKDEKVWESPFEFKPERFLGTDIDVFGQNYNILPFGSGRRMCIGAKLGFEMLQMGIATLVQAFDWELPKDRHAQEENMDEAFGLTCCKKEPLVAVANARLATHVYAV